MFAVIQTGGKQYKVASNDTLVVEKLTGEPGEKVTFDVLAVGSEKQIAVGAPTVSGAKVTAEILSHGQGEKVVIFKKKRRQNYRRTKGHRQPYTALFITEIVDDKGNKVAADNDKKPKARTAAEPKKAEKKAPAKKAAAKPAAKPAAKKAAAKPAAKKAEPKKTEAKKADAKPAAKKAESKPAAKKPAAKKTDTKKKD